ncbi:uncharacterized protein At1g51745 isoform X1 [Dendrobium catenatum]|uniref:PWWP domain-containing protein n=1 Tax=Dendrobium catenatum TaxID=906689 RepID=A0A2I0W0V8_9ASPA|nr:uncharacterized protein At1g51745 isoform X1 [Dendrobium catenatum]PKU69291.1 Uncharacterized protein MA16_Dca002561 [Dendrobium catenatum]
MESSAAGDGGGVGVDCGVGTIVWVRRRNGSWWPGRILGSDELSASHLMSPRSGTPVKLLGREDASVDWYNLEKSKRVKAFRCGEFDACIERAEASQGTPIKKREKYARREDAILHALELEKKQLGLQQRKRGIATYVMSRKNSGSHRSEFSNLCSPESYMIHDDHVSDRKLSDKPQNILTETDFSEGEENLNGPTYANNRSVKQFRWEDDNSEVMPRMRGLQDFGLRTAQSKKKLSQFDNWRKSGKPLDNYVEVPSGSGCNLEDAVHATNSKNCVSVKRKRSQSRLVEESLLRKRDRRRPLVQVLQSSAKLASHLFQCNYNTVGISMPREKEQVQSICRAKRNRCAYLPRDSDETFEHAEHDSESMPENQFGASKFLDNPVDVVEGYISSGMIEANDSDSSEADYLEPNMGALANILTDTAHVLLPGSKDCEAPEFQVSDKFRKLNDPHSGLISQLNEHITDVSAEVGVSKWHMKGKRNCRNIGKRPMDASDGKINSAENCNGFMNETTYENKASSLNFERAELSNERALSWRRESFYNCDESDLIDKDLAENQLNLYDDWRNPVSLQTTKDDGRNHSSLSLNDSDNHSPSIWEADGPSNLTHSTFWEEPTENFHPVYASDIVNEMEPFLVDVDLKVEASYQGEHVPLVSLMSRLNGKAIIGHPVQIEILEIGSTIHLFSKFDVISDETAAPQPMWRTGRRTAMQRVPRVNPLTTAVDDEDPSDHGSKPPSNKKPYSGYLNHQTRLPKKSIFHTRSKKFQKKISKRLSSSSQKTRTLSSFASGDKLDDESSGVKLTRSNNDIMEGLIKPEGSVPLVACVPVKVVFSRLLEAVGKPSAAAVTRRIRMNSPAIRAPS